ncbi:UDP-glucose 4-epimerase, putative [Perkinsus marinus ATCC 50983]|uniref:UDP-glucose 4-epimerase, putative n=1 Tax=Perkinsus marinus (strain ATCC 50983 / TXsc) TaxID=423536 RepID=C5LH01_PERM5|nr:UDP-glucose 4-epimerase, putative [Perkinsus marinus ATCC 50983]EER03972.1 UDP-glucose 4-epimerase, putative [Perkinsus marinus ATCC 50983]|eukprot:XP_002772156.1 UDP-glucose 4-epimerase, putative [Perkinsus marinus ATCC 50983]
MDNTSPQLGTGMVPGLDNAETVLWPRGYPLSYIRRDRATTTAKPSRTLDTWTREIAVVQTLADNDPDFDAIYRLTRPLPVDFHQLLTSAFLLAPPTFTPLNAQACLFKAYDALWGLYLPVTVSIYPYSIVWSHPEQVHGRVSDIWRSFVLQRLLWDLGASVAVAGRTWVRQLRNSHDYLADFIAEDDVYKKAEAMMRFLVGWSPTSGNPFLGCNCAVLGINGMIGSNIAKALVRLSYSEDPTRPHYTVFGLVRYRANLGNLAGVLEDVHLTYGDLSDAQRIRSIVQEVRPHLVFHFAAQGINGVSFQSESLTYQANVEGTSNVMQALRGTSDSVDYIGRPIPESAPMSPVSPYGVSKAATEMMCLQQYKAHGTHCVAVRLFIHVSPGGTEALALQEFCRQVAMIEGGKQEPVIRHGALKTRRDTTDVRDSAEQFIKVLESSAPGEVYNVGSFMGEATGEDEHNGVGQCGQGSSYPPH